MPNKATEWLFGRATQIVVAAVLAAATGLWERVARTATWPEVAVLALVTFVCLVWAADKFWRFPLRWRVRQWLDDTGFDVKTIPDATAEFSFVLTDSIGVKTSIRQAKPYSPIVIAVASITPPQAKVDVFNAWPQAQKIAFWRDVRMEFMRHGIEFSELKIDAPGLTLSTQIMPSSDLTSLEFIDTVLHVRSGARLYLEHLESLQIAKHRTWPT